MYSEMLKLGKESLIYGLSTVLVRLLNFILMPFYTHYLLPQEYGIVATIYSYVAFFNIIYGYGLNQGYMRHFDQKNSLSSSFNVVFYTSLILSAIIWFFSGWFAYVSAIGKENYKLVQYASIILCLDAITLIPFADLRIKHRPFKFVFIRAISITINVLLNVVFLAYMDVGIKGVFIANIISSAISVIMLSSYFECLFEKIDFSMLKKIFNYSLPFLPAGLSIMIVQVMDRPILLKLSDASSAGIYQANYRLAIVMSMIVTMFDQAWRPFVIERAKDPNASAIFSKIFKYFSFFCASIWLFFSLFIKDIVSIEINSKPIVAYTYHSGLFLVPIIMGAYFFNGIYVNFLAPVMISKKTKAIMYVCFIGAAVNLFLNFSFIPSYGIKAAAWSVLASYALMSLFLRLFTRKDYSISYEYWKFSLIVILALLCYFTVYYFSDILDDCSLVAFKAIMFLIYPLLCYLTNCFSQREVLSFSSLIREKFSKKY